MKKNELKKINCDNCDDELEDTVLMLDNIYELKHLALCSNDCLIEIMENSGLIWTEEIEEEEDK